MRDIKNFLANLSHHPGVYQMLDAQGVVIYVGKAKDIKKRITTYFGNKSLDQKTLTMVAHISNVDVTLTSSESEAVLLESNLIKKHRPRYNVLLRDDKSYPYILITSQHKFPRIDLYRGPRKKQGTLFGPYPSAYAVRETISLLQKIFMLRTCRDTYFDSRIRPCLLYQIQRCSGPCVGLISPEEYAVSVNLAVLFLQGKSDQVIQILQTRMQSASELMNFELAATLRDQISRLRTMQNRQYVHVAKGNADIIGFTMTAGVACIQLLSIRGGQVLDSRAYFPTLPVHAVPAEIISAFISQHYLYHPSHIESIPKEIIVPMEVQEQSLLENALSEIGKRKVKISSMVRLQKKKWLNMATTSAKQSLSAQLFNRTNMRERMAALKTSLQLDKEPYRIECFDVSHTMGEATVASCVVFDHAGPVKSDYRRYNITHVTRGDDVAAMQQVLSRRFKKLQADAGRLPDIVFIDGGLTQLNVAHQVFTQLHLPILLIGISKGPDRKPGFETLHRLNVPAIHLPADDLGLHFIQQIRDEAHRFAITGHRQRRDKVRRHSTLELIPGIGSKRRRELLRYFGGIQGILHASLDEIAQVPGINQSLAERIFATLHDATK